LGSKFLRTRVQCPKSALFYGPSGGGKTFMWKIIA